MSNTVLESVNTELIEEIKSYGLFDDNTDSNYEKYVEQFAAELVDIGIETAENFNDRFEGARRYEYGQSAEANFTEETVEDCVESEIPTWVVVDYQRTWDSNLRFDYSTIEMDGYTYFFHN
tara:strand:- start:486 stop:848 length:363 start_codon:yes stop_codon:yes gene_type:complete